MEILYVSRLCSERRLADLLRDHPVKPPQQEQKFHGLLARGLAACTGSVTALSLLPFEPGGAGFPSTASDSEKGITYRYLSLRLIPVFSHIIVSAWSFLSCLRWSLARRGRARFVICDVLDLSISAGALMAAKVSGARSVAIVTDVPAHLHDYIGGKGGFAWAYRRLSTFFMERYDGYLLLTEAMNALVNRRGKPHLIMEGLVDSGMGEVGNTLQEKYPERVILYAGALYRKYGVGALLEAFQKVPEETARLWLYGAGELEEEIMACERRDPRIKYWRVRPNPEVVEAEIRATLLVNPRPSGESFTRFSFPSKNMEYMASGTPVLTTRLPGMPEEYLDHVFTFRDESVDGMAATLDWLLQRPREELHLRGQGAKTFVLTQKNHLVQAGRVQDFLRALTAGVS